MPKKANTPEWSKCIAAEPDRFFQAISSPIGREILRIADRRGRYLHWEDFRRRPMPAGFSAEEAWAVVKLARQTQRKPMPTRTVSGVIPAVVVTDPLRVALRRIDLHIGLKEAGLPEANADDARTFGFRAAIEEALASSRIEGADSTRQRARELIRKKQRPRTLGEQMILNNYRALQEIDDWIDQPLTPALLLRIQSVVTADAVEDPLDVGRFRKDDEVRVRDRISGEVVHVPPPVREVEARMQALCEFANQGVDDDDYLHPLVRAAVLHYQLAYDHPFGDGNGRTARWLFLWAMLKCPEFWWFRYLPVSRMIDRARAQYYRSFTLVESDNWDLAYFVRFQVRCVENEIESLERFLRRRQTLRDHARRELRLEDHLNLRQLALFDFVTRHPEEVFHQIAHAQYHDVTKVTAGRDLKQLVEFGLLKSRKEGRTIHYTATARFKALARGAQT